MSTRSNRARACSSVKPTVPISGVVNTADATQSWLTAVGLPPNSVSAKAWPSRMATGVRFTRLVTSPTA